MINYNISQLVAGPSADRELETPEAYGFNARLLLQQLADILVNMLAPDPGTGRAAAVRMHASPRPWHRPGVQAFITAMAQDERSYSAETMRRAVASLRSVNFADVCCSPALHCTLTHPPADQAGDAGAAHCACRGSRLRLPRTASQLHTGRACAGGG